MCTSYEFVYILPTDHPGRYLQAPSKELLENVKVVHSPEEAAQDAHAIAVLTEWDEFKAYDYKKVCVFEWGVCHGNVWECMVVCPA